MWYILQNSRYDNDVSRICKYYSSVLNLLHDFSSESKESDVFKSIWSNCETHSKICPHSIDNMELDYSNNI